MDYTYALEAVTEHTGWHSDDIIMIAEYSDGFEFRDRSGAEWIVYNQHGEYRVAPAD